MCVLTNAPTPDPHKAFAAAFMAEAVTSPRPDDFRKCLEGGKLLAVAGPQADALFLEVSDALGTNDDYGHKSARANLILLFALEAAGPEAGQSLLGKIYNLTSDEAHPYRRRAALGIASQIVGDWNTQFPAELFAKALAHPEGEGLSLLLPILGLDLITKGDWEDIETFLKRFGSELLGFLGEDRKGACNSFAQSAVVHLFNRFLTNTDWHRPLAQLLIAEVDQAFNSNPANPTALTNGVVQLRIQLELKEEFQKAISEAMEIIYCTPYVRVIFTSDIYKITRPA